MVRGLPFLAPAAGRPSNAIDDRRTTTGEQRIRLPLRRASRGLGLLAEDVSSGVQVRVQIFQFAAHAIGHCGDFLVRVLKIIPESGQLLLDVLRHVLHELAGILKQLIAVRLRLIEILSHPREFFGKNGHKALLIVGRVVFSLWRKGTCPGGHASRFVEPSGGRPAAP
jgi:hypothetical protein